MIAEGAKTRFGVGNDLLENAGTIRRIIAPSEGAFSKYDEILGAIKRNSNRDTLVLVALGPTATILSYEIGRTGIQTIDIGHLDIEYEWYKSNTKKKTPIIGKYVNEAGGDSSVELDDLILKKYHYEIIEEI